MIRIEPREQVSRLRQAILPVLAGLLALLLLAVPLIFADVNILQAYALMFKGFAGSTFAFTEVLVRATPLIFTGLAAAVAFRAKLWNIGAEGQLYLGALATVIVGTGVLNLPPLLLMLVIIIAGAIAGAIGMLIPAWLRIRFGADEVVTTLLLNFIILLLVQMLLEGLLKDPMGMGWPQSEPVVEEAMLPTLVPRMRLHGGLILGLVLAVFIHLFISRSVWGFKVRAVGENAAATKHAGIAVNRTLLSAAMLSGALAGLAGVGEVAGLKGYLTADISPGYGYAGIVVAMLAGLSPLGVVAAAVFIAAVFVGADSMSRSLGVSNYLADLFVALSLLCVLIGGFLNRYRILFVGSSTRK